MLMPRSRSLLLRGIKEVVVLDTCQAAMNDLLSRNAAGGRLGLSTCSSDPGAEAPPDLGGSKDKR